MQMNRKRIRKIPALAAACALAWLSMPALAQSTPADVRDLVGARAAGAESQLLSRGYVSVGGSQGDDRKWTYWWNEQRGVCLSVTTREGRYDAIVATPAPDCRQSDARGGAPEFRDPGPQDGYREHIALVCYGEGHKLGNELKSGYEYDTDKRKYVARSGVELKNQDYDTSLTIDINGERGRIRPAKEMVPPIHADNEDGWFPITDLNISRDFIRGAFKLNNFNQPKITIDRRNGHIALDGMSKFSGTCDSLDRDRKF